MRWEIRTFKTLGLVLLGVLLGYGAAFVELFHSAGASVTSVLSSTEPGSRPALVEPHVVSRLDPSEQATLKPSTAKKPNIGKDLLFGFLIQTRAFVLWPGGISPAMKEVYRSPKRSAP